MGALSTPHQIGIKICNFLPKDSVGRPPGIVGDSLFGALYALRATVC